MTISDNIYDSFDIYNSNMVIGSAKIIDSSYTFFSYDIRGSNNVIFSAGVVNGEYVIYNKKVPKEEFKRFFEDLKQQIKTYSGYRKAKEEFRKVKNAFPHKASDITNSENCYGSSIVNCKNVMNGFEATNLEDCRHVTYAKYGKDIMDAHGIYPEANKCYEVVAVGY